MSVRAIRPILLHRGRDRAKRPKTFSTEEAAKAWASANKIEKFDLENLKNDSAKVKKFRVVPLQ